MGQSHVVWHIFLQVDSICDSREIYICCLSKTLVSWFFSCLESRNIVSCFLRQKTDHFLYHVLLGMQKNSWRFWGVFVQSLDFWVEQLMQLLLANEKNAPPPPKKKERRKVIAKNCLLNMQISYLEGIGRN